jgi:hypothetical protein
VNKFDGYTAYLPFFGDTEKFYPHLQRVMKELQTHCVGLPIQILSDTKTELPRSPQVRFEPDEKLIRREHVTGRAFDLKAALVVALLESRPEHSPIVLDIDNFIRRDFSDVLDTIPHSASIAMPPSPQEPYSKPIVVPSLRWDGVNGPVPEHTSSFMVFKGGRIGDVTAALFRAVIAEASDDEYNHYLREQRSWSVSWAHLNHVGLAHLLPRTMGWSRFWNPKEPADTYVRHKHGKEKWDATP